MLDSSRNWWAYARLRLEHAANSERNRDLGSGRLADMVSLALSRPESERSHLFIEVEPQDSKIAWPEIAALAQQPDCPVYI